MVEPPDVIADTIVTFANVCGRENVISDRLRHALARPGGVGEVREHRQGSRARDQPTVVEATMIKIISAAIKHPRNRTLPEFQEYWAARHGPMFARTPHLRGYVQHITLREA